MKLLIAEDEVKTGEYLRQGLSEAGFVVDLARHRASRDGLRIRLTTKIDDGFDLKLIQTVRGMGYMTDTPTNDSR